MKNEVWFEIEIFDRNNWISPMHNRKYTNYESAFSSINNLTTQRIMKVTQKREIVK